MRSIVSRLIAAVILAFGLAASPLAQSFEVATVKSTPADQVGPEQPSIVQFLPNGFRRTNSTLRTLVRTAYDVQDYQVAGGPDWADSRRFDVEARHTGNVPRADVLRMLQRLLADRFQLTVRRETREGPTYNLVRVPDAKALIATTDSTPANVRFGAYAGRRSMGQLAQYLAGIVGRPVVDRTALAGNHELRLSFAPDLRDTDRPTVFAALQEQLGLRLEPARGPIETIAIESAGLPAGN
jgi:uncharacterized protein (TIGR03435 family)